MIGAILRLMRPGDWVKNVFVLPALVFALPNQLSPIDAGDQMAVPALLLATAVAFVAFCLLSSGFYCINDVVDVAEDRLHPVKRSRPVASGAVPVPVAMAVGVGSCGAALLLGFLVNAALGFTLVAYAVLQILYNLKLKRVIFVDVVAVAIGFGLRAAAGAVAIEVQISVWLLLCVFFLCLYLGFIKRLCDLTSAERAGGDGWHAPAGYDDRIELNWLLGISAVLAVVAYLMYAMSPHARQLFGIKAVGLALLIPLVVITIHRFYRRAMRGLSDSPLAALRGDRAVLASIVLFVGGTVATLYVPAIEQMLSKVFYVADE